MFHIGNNYTIVRVICDYHFIVVSKILFKNKRIINTIYKSYINAQLLNTSGARGNCILDKIYFNRRLKKINLNYFFYYFHINIKIILIAVQTVISLGKIIFNIHNSYTINTDLIILNIEYIESE